MRTLHEDVKAAQTSDGWYSQSPLHIFLSTQMLQIWKWDENQNQNKCIRIMLQSQRVCPTWIIWTIAVSMPQAGAPRSLEGHYSAKWLGSIYLQNFSFAVVPCVCIFLVVNCFCDCRTSCLHLFYEFECLGFCIISVVATHLCLSVTDIHVHIQVWSCLNSRVAFHPTFISWLWVCLHIAATVPQKTLITVFAPFILYLFFP